MSQLKVNSIVPVGGLPSGANGGIIQVVQAVKTDRQSFSGTSFTDISSLSASITPSSSSNKILCMTSLYLSSAGGSSSTAKINFVRGSTNICQPTGTSTSHQAAFFVYFGSSNGNMVSNSAAFLDSPATTSATTYKIQLGLDNTQSTFYINRYHGGDSYHGTSSLTLYEISG